ncbi:MAG: crotonase [Pelagibacteraceae bacterium]|nr:crotonase [Pelagibacteraceae bacterium]
MPDNYKKVVVIGAGTMGSGIAAHLANSNIPTILLDLPSKDEDKNKISNNAIVNIKKSDPPLLVERNCLNNIQAGNLEDDFHQISDADWIIEAVVERIDIKHKLYKQIELTRNPNSIVSSNTSTIPLSILTQEMSEEMKNDFCITHFFNPVRFMRLLEIVETEKLNQNKILKLRSFCEHQLGKGIVNCKDTPGFIGNRVGVYAMQVAMYEALERNLPVEIADALFGRPMGIPKTGVFGLYDLIGIDLMKDVLQSFEKELKSDDPFMSVVKPHKIVEKLLENGFTGNKGKGGFYENKIVEGNEFTKALNYESFEYYDFKKVDLELAHKVEKDGIKALFDDQSQFGEYAFCVFEKIVNYCAYLIPEVTENLIDIDDALRMGFNWYKGPFELLQEYGLKKFIERTSIKSHGFDFLYKILNSQGNPYGSSEASYYQFQKGSTKINRGKNIYRLGDIQKYSKPLIHNQAASTWMIEDHSFNQNIVCVEFHTKANALNGLAMEILYEAIEITDKHNASGLVVYNEAMNFSAGADLNTLIGLADDENWQGIDLYLSSFQNTCSLMKYAPFPTVSAISGLAIGGGFEVACQSDRIVAHMNSTVGLVETGVGLVPGGGGCKELLWRWVQDPKFNENHDKAALEVFNIIGYGKIATSPSLAIPLKLILKEDLVVENRDQLLFKSFELINFLKSSYKPPKKPLFTLSGLSVKDQMHEVLKELESQHIISGYDIDIGLYLADVLSGGANSKPTNLTEQDLYDLERQSLISLIQSHKTRDRIHMMLATGRRLKN